MTWETNEYGSVRASKTPPVEDFARSLLPGQLANYLRAYELRYGFITTYYHTMIVKYTHWTTREADDILLISRPIPHDQAFQQGHRVSVRQAIWYLMLQAEHEDSWKLTQTLSTGQPGQRSAQAGGGGGGSARGELPPPLGTSGAPLVQRW